MTMRLLNVVLLASIIFSWLPGITFGYDLKVTDLQCDFKPNPLGIDNKQPQLAWKIVSDGQRDIFQVAYQVLVASSVEKLKEKDADVWNSGMVNSTNSVHIHYAGKELESATRYYWKVSIQDNLGNTSPFSEPYFFETALLDQEDWKGHWISAPSVWDWPEFISTRKANAEQDFPPWDNRAPMFRKEFSLSKEVKSARMYISGLGFYEAYLNGEKIGDIHLDPAFTRYDKTILYSIFDITSSLKERNAVGIMLGNGWFNMVTQSNWGFDRAPWRGKPRVKMQIEVVYTDGTKEIVVTDETWKASLSPVTFNSIMRGIVYDARLEQVGWDSPGFDDGKWKETFVVPSPGGQMRMQTMAPVRKFKEFPPLKITKTADGRYLIDFSQNIAGWAVLKARGASGDQITLRYGEELDNDSVDHTNVNTYTKGDVQTDVFILNGNGNETFETKFTYHGFQFIEVIGYPGELTPDKISAIAAGTDFKTRGTFECSNDLINRIQQNTLWSYRSNFVGYPTDCPQREKNGWTGDAHIAVETGLWNFHANREYAKFMQDMADEQRPDGNLPAIIPTSQWGYHWGNGPDWIGAYAFIPWEMYLYDGDLETAEKHYERIKNMVSFFSGKAENHILSLGLGDWAPFKTKTPVAITSTAFYYKFTDILSRLAKTLYKEEDHAYYRDLSEKIKTSFIKEFYDPATGIVGNGSQTAQSCALYMGLVDPSERQKVVNVLVDTVKSTDFHIDTGILGAKFLLHALSDNGHPGIAWKIVTNETYPGWGWWMKQGATTLWEFWDKRASKPHGSLNHIMYGDVSNWFYRNIAGINTDQDAPGFRHFVIQPQLIDQLEWCKASFESNYGTIKSDWRKKGKKLIMEITVPCNTSATVIFPASSVGSVLEGGKSLKQRNIEVLSYHSGSISLRVGSGNYVFESGSIKR